EGEGGGWQLEEAPGPVEGSAGWQWGYVLRAGGCGPTCSLRGRQGGGVPTVPSGGLGRRKLLQGLALPRAPSGATLAGPWALESLPVALGIAVMPPAPTAAGPVPRSTLPPARSCPVIRRRSPPRAPWLWCGLWAANRNACAARFTPRRVRLDLTRPPVFFQLAHSPSQLQNL